MSDPGEVSDRHADAVHRTVTEATAALLGLYMMYEMAPQCGTCNHPRGLNDHCIECVFKPSVVVEAMDD